MELTFINEYDQEFDIYENIYCELMEKTFNILERKGNYYVEVNLVNNETIHKINAEYRHIDRETDVISFAFDDEVEGEIKIKDDEIPHMLGEIFISVDKAKSQAEEYGNTLGREMRFLFIHGLLHLSGYDHMTTEDEKVMFDLQDRILG
ncbi:MAG: rRNA maturation RNase YbeY [Bacilli bacterium]|nr:rRNA maturation RNase YbeY [Bacilli bacterium]